MIGETTHVGIELGVGLKELRWPDLCLIDYFSPNTSDAVRYRCIFIAT